MFRRAWLCGIPAALLASACSSSGGGENTPPDPPEQVAITGTAALSGGAPAAGARVQLVGGAVATICDAAGKFALTAIPRGAWLLELTVDADHDGTIEAGLHGVSADTRTTAEATLALGQLTLAGAGTLRGTVTRNGAPADAYVVVELAAGGPTTAGAFSFEHLAPGSYDVVAVTPTERSPRSRVTIGAEPAVVELKLGMAAQGVIRGRVSGPEDRSIVFVAGEERAVTPDPEGAFASAAELAPGIYSIVGRAAGARVAVLPFVVAGAGDVALPPMLLASVEGCGGASAADADGDGLPDADESPGCRCVAGASDLDADGLCDPLDPDVDGDAVPDVVDLCPLTPGPQTDTDGDGLADVCDPDDDGDDVSDATDDCPLVANADQVDVDDDGVGDACDPLVDRDDDGVADDADNCPDLSNTEQTDLDGDDRGDACDPLIDSDGDQVGDAADNCPAVENADQADVDGDALGDACDPLIDSDGDLVADTGDNCPNVSNAPQLESDGDHIGDACDNCPAVSNATQADVDRDGVGDACDVPPDPWHDGIASDFEASWEGPFHSPILAIAGTSLDDFWVLSDPDQLTHWDGARWTIDHTLPRNAVFGLATGAQPWAWGEGQRRWDGTEWVEVVDSPSRSSPVVVRPGTDHAYLEGEGVSLIADGAVVTLAAAGGGVSDVAVGPDGDVFVLTSGKPYLYDESLDAFLPSGAPVNSGEFCVREYGLASGVWAVCVQSIGGKAFLLRWDGDAWTRLTTDFPPGTINPVTIVGTSADEAFVLNGGGGVLRWSAGTWSRLPPAPFAVWTTAWSPASGRIVLGSTSGNLALWDGSAWTFSGASPSPWLRSLSGGSAGDLWALEGNTAAVLHRTGGAWRVVDHGDARRVTSVRAFSATDVWIAGAEGFVARGNETDGFTRITDGPGATSELLGSIVGTSSTDVWVGYSRGTLSWHWDGATWTSFSIVPAGEYSLGADGFLVRGLHVYRWSSNGSQVVAYTPAQQPRAIWGFGNTEVWVVGAGGSVARWTMDSNTWTPLDTGGITDELRSIWGASPDDVWIAGEHAFLHWDGDTFTRTPMPGHDTANLVGFAANDVWATGSLLQFDGTQWGVVEDHLDAAVDPVAVLSLDAERAFLFGQWEAASWDGAMTRRLPLPFESGSVLAAAAVGPDEGWGVGAWDGTVAHYLAGEWAVVEKGSEIQVLRVAARAANDVWFVDAEGGVWRWDGVAILRDVSAPDGIWRDVAVDGAGRIVLAGESAAVWVREGATWSPIDLRATCGLDEEGLHLFDRIATRPGDATGEFVVGGDCLVRVRGTLAQSLPAFGAPILALGVRADGTVLATYEEFGRSDGESAPIPYGDTWRYDEVIREWKRLELPARVTVRHIATRSDGGITLFADDTSVLTSRAD